MFDASIIKYGQVQNGVMMRILAISDVIVRQLQVLEIPQRFRDIDLIISCGDLPFDYLEYLVSRLGKDLYYVYGNHAQTGVLDVSGEIKLAPEGCQNLHGRVVNHKGLLIGGLEGSVLYNGGPFQYTQREMSWMVRRMVPKLLWNTVRYGRPIDILVTHAPPWGIHDAPDAAHQGFVALPRFIRRYRPRYLLHGHIHLYRQDAPRITQYGETTVINCYGYQIIDVDLDEISQRRVRAKAITH